ncbi:NTP transferase domain-containing protein [Halovenus sp. WSH3]|uniref:NTP transferase domain-containing protein n=1 Tax=Halovenus carboxidivorans TaxID=2692199 RepID=A0A6B0T794_9EURY|nr:nucleotidyltransferase family protein [Halovenus carboxidivorans]MXR52817.1 NTP transferase domain-containing protein [Halovenus carboxidivorans]
MTPELPVVEPPAGVENPVREGPVAGVLLAAGTSSRFGEANKLLAEVDGEPLVSHAARTLAAAAVDPVVVVVGADGDSVTDALDGFDTVTVENPDYEEGQATSVRAGVRAVRARVPDAAAAVFALGDMPAVRPESVDALVAAYRDGAGTALAAADGGQRGNPVLFDAQHFDALAAVDGDVGGREILLEDERSALVETGDAGVRRDIDTEADLERLRDEW